MLLVIKQSTTGIIFYVNKAPIQWYSKRQNTIESSTFGSECVGLRTAVEMNEALRYKLRMMGVPVEGPTNCFCDNQSVVKNATIPQSSLLKKHNMVAYHKVRDAMGAARVANGKLRRLPYEILSGTCVQKMCSMYLASRSMTSVWANGALCVQAKEKGGQRKRKKETGPCEPSGKQKGKRKPGHVSRQVNKKKIRPHVGR